MAENLFRKTYFSIRNIEFILREEVLHQTWNSIHLVDLLDIMKLRH